MDKMKPCHPMTLKEDIKGSTWRKIHEEAEARKQNFWEKLKET